MEVQLTLRGSLAAQLEGGRGRVALPEEATVRVLLEQLRLPPQCVAVVNGTAVRGGVVLHDGDQVQVFAPQAGGCK
jgi:sulfur carrier protein ThiS